MVFMPPQNGKSELVSRRFPAYALGKDPDLRIIACSYNADLAGDMSRDVQKIMGSERYRGIFPGTRLATSKDDEVKQVGKFDVVGKRGAYVGAGVRGGITGKSADIGIIDDPIKNREEAESEVIRKACWEWYVSTFSSRLFGDTGRVVLVMTRWHEGDLAGRLLRLAAEDGDSHDSWKVVELPAIAERVTAGDPRAPGEALWPERYPVDELERRRALSPYDFAALYQQRPAPPEGGVFPTDWEMRAIPTERKDEHNGHVTQLHAEWCRAWDCAATKPENGSDPDYTVGTLMAMVDGCFYIKDVKRFRDVPNEVDKAIKQAAEQDPPGTMIREEEEGGHSGKSVISSHVRLLAGYDFEGVRATGKKETRWRPMIVQVGAGNVFVVPKDDGSPPDWFRDWKQEMGMVPFARHDDTADSAALAFNSLALGLRRVKQRKVLWG
jgi:predicted phage terminase large subunit-like protein